MAGVVRTAVRIRPRCSCTEPTQLSYSPLRHTVLARSASVIGIFFLTEQWVLNIIAGIRE
jgi:hypothetical protein